MKPFAVFISGIAAFVGLAAAINSRGECLDAYSTIPNVKSICDGLPMAEATQTVTSYRSVVTSVVTKTAYSYRYTLTYTTTPTLQSQSTSCYAHRTLISTVAPAYIDGTSARPSPSYSSSGGGSSCPVPTTDIQSVCDCLFPQKTVTVTLPSTTFTSTVSTGVFIYSPTFRTLAPACTGNVNIYNGASYGSRCHVKAIPAHVCEAGSGYANSSTLYAFDHRSCCNACANTFNCVQAITSPGDNKCTLIISANSTGDTSSTNDCSLGHPSVQFGSPIGGASDYWPGVGGSLMGHCAGSQ